MKLQAVHAEISKQLEKMGSMFKPHMKLSFVARDPDNPECTIIVTEDDLEGLAEILRLYANREGAKQ